MTLLPVSLCVQNTVLTPSTKQGSIPAGEDGAGCLALDCVLFGPLLAPLSLLRGA